MAQLISLMIGSLAGGGAERSVVNLANIFARRGHTVEIALIGGKLAESPYRALIDSEVTVVELDCALVSNGLLTGVERIRNSLAILKAIGGYIEERQPPVIFANLCTHNVLLANRFFSSFHAKVVVTEHVTTTIFSRLEIIKKRLTYRYADKIISVCYALQKEFIDMGFPAEKLLYIYNPSVTQTLLQKAAEPPAHKWLIAHTKPVIIAVGRLQYQKNYPMLLNAFALVRQSIDALLIIAGIGDLENELKTQAKQLQIDQFVDFAGFVDNPYPLFKTADLFVLSSHFEGFGIVVAEALACGCSVVSTNCPVGPAEILDNGKYGRLTPLGDTAAFAQAVIETLRNPLDKQLLIERSNLFSNETVAKEYDDLLAKLLPADH